MSCPTCDHTMHQMGCRSTDLPFFWCPRCGTIKTCDATVGVPVLIDRCRKFGESLIGECAEHTFQWKQLGIAESINVPTERLAP